jgi:hypothetical protein
MGRGAEATEHGLHPYDLGAYAGRAVVGDGLRGVATEGGHLGANTWTQQHYGKLSVVWIRGSAANDVWGVGDGISHFDGVDWSPLPGPSEPQGVWAFGPNDVWFGSLHWNGVTLSETNTSEMGRARPVIVQWGSGPTDLWASRDAYAFCLTWSNCNEEDGEILHWDGSGWQVVQTTGQDSVVSIHGSSPTNVWAVTRGPVDTWTVLRLQR